MPRDTVNIVRHACRPGQACRLVGLRVLLVDENSARRAVRSRALERHGFVVRGASSMADALDAMLNARWTCDVAVMDLDGGAIPAVTLLNALRGFRPWLPAVIVGSDEPPAGPALRDPGIETAWITAAESPVALSAAIMSVSCPGLEPPDCAFRRLIGKACNVGRRPILHAVAALEA